jgi:hypothetical protein
MVLYPFWLIINFQQFIIHSLPAWFNRLFLWQNSDLFTFYFAMNITQF